MARRFGPEHRSRVVIAMRMECDQAAEDEEELPSAAFL